MLAKADQKNTTAQQIDSQENFFIEIDNNPDRVLKIIFDIYTIYTKYLNQTNNANKQYNQIYIVILRLE